MNCSTYTNLFEHPSSEKIIINHNNHKKFISTFKNYERLHKFLVEIDYEPYTIHISDKKDSSVIEYCSDFFQYVYISHFNRM